MANIEVKVPDIGDFESVPVIEIHVEPGSVVAPEDSLITLESDKATMDIPAPAGGKVVELKVAIGDHVSEGSLILTLEGEADGAGATPASAPAASGGEDRPPAAAAPAAATHGGGSDIDCEVMVLGAGPGGYSAAFRSADLGMKTVLVERWSTLGGVCLNVGCIPSKALLHTAAVMDEVKAMAAHGIAYGAPEIDLDKLRDHKDKVVGKLTGGLAGMAKARKVEVVTGTGTFLDPHHAEVALSDGSGKKVVKFEKAIIAAGSEAVKLPFIPDDPRIVDSTGALELRDIPKRMLVIGGGIIGLEMANVYSTLGARIDVVEMLDGLMAGADRDLVRVWEKVNGKHRFDNIMLETKTVSAEAKDGWHPCCLRRCDKAPAGPRGLRHGVWWLSGAAPMGLPDRRRQGWCRRRGSRLISTSTEQMRTNVAHIFAIGDIVGQPMLAHKAVHEAHVAAEAAATARTKPSSMPARSRPWPIPIRRWRGPV